MQKYRNFFQLGKAPWFSVLVQPKYLSYFANSSNSFYDTHPLFCEFTHVVDGIIMANAAMQLEAPHPERSEFIRREALAACRTEAGRNACCHVLSTLPAGAPLFEHLSQGVRNEGGFYVAPLHLLTAGEMAMCVIYPYLGRMGTPVFSEQFAKDGSTARYLLAIYNRLEKGFD